jgi:hypothetical protein
VCGYKFNREFSWTRAPSLKQLREEGLERCLLAGSYIHSSQDMSKWEISTND